MKPFVIERVLQAPRSRVWKAWTEAAELRKWWGPQGFKLHTCKLDLRPGGTFLYGMTVPDGSDLWGKFIFREIVPPRKLVFTVSFSDPKGGVTRNPWRADWPRHILSTVEFEEQGPNQTRLSVTWLPYEASETERKAFDAGRDSLGQGWGGTLEKLAQHLTEGVEHAG